MKSWQLVPYDSFEFGSAREIQVGELVQVITPISPHYQEWGKVQVVSDLGVEVLGQKPNTKVDASVKPSMTPELYFDLVLGTALVFGDRRGTA